MFKWFLKRLWNKVATTRAERRRTRRLQPATVRPHFDCLEDRITPTATLSYPGATLLINVTGNDAVTLSATGGKLVVTDANGVSDTTTGKFTLTATTATENANLATDGFTLINISSDNTAGQTVTFTGGSFVATTASNPGVGFSTATSAFSGNLGVTTSTAITQSAAITGTTASFSAAANAITLTNAGNSFTGAVTLSNSGANNVQLTNASATSLAASTVGQNLTVTSGGTITETGVLTVPGTLTTSSVTGTNLATFTNAVASFNASNSGSGAVSLLDSAGTLNITGISDIAAGGTVTVNNTGGAISLTGTITAGLNTVNLTASTSLTQTPAGSTVTAGTLNASAASIGTGGQSLVFNTNSLTTNTSASNGNQFLADTATVSLGAGAISAGTGTTTLTGGTFQAASTTAFSGGNVTDNATIDLNGNNNSVLAFNGSGSVINSGVAATLTVTGGGSFSGNITGSNTALTVGGATQTLILSGNNTYGGLTTINSGDTLKAGSTTGFSASSTVTDNGILDLAGFSNSVGGLGGNGSVTNSGAAGAATLTITGAGNFSGVISDGATATTALTVSSSGTETLSGASPNTYSGLTTVTAGTLSLAKTANVTAIPGNVSVSGGLLQGAATNQFATTTAITETGGSISANVGGTGQSFASLTISGGTYSTNGGTSTVSGATAVSGTAILNVNSSGTGGVFSTTSLSVTGGTVNIGNSTATTQTLIVGSGGLAFSGGSILVGNSNPGTSGATAKLVLNGDVTSSNTVTIGTNANTATETIQVDLGGGAPRNFTTTGGTLTIAPSIVNGALTKLGAGTLTLSGVSTYVGATSVSVGTLNLAGSITSNVTVSSGATLSGSGNGTTTGVVTGTLAVNSGGNLAPNAGVSTPLTVTGNATLSSGSNYKVTISNAATGNYSQLSVGGTITVTGANLTVNGTGAGLTTASQQNFRIVQNTGVATVVGTFSGYPEGAPVTVTGSAVTPTITYNGALANNIDLNTQPVVNGTTGTDNFIFRKSVTPGFNEYSTNGGTSFTTVANTLGVTFNGGAGADTLIYDFVNGDPGVSVTFNGGGQAGDTLIVKGAGTGTAVYSVNTIATPQHAGAVTVGSDVISFTGLAPTDVEGFASVLINNTTFTAANQALTIANGTDAGGNPTINVSGTTGGTAFETLRLRNDTSVSIDTTTPAGNDTVAITSADGTAAQANITNLSINTGTGTDTVSINGAVNLPGALTITTQTLNVTAATTAGTITLTAGQNITVIANITGGAGGTTLLASGTAAQNTTGVLIQSGAVVTASGNVSVTGTGGGGAGIGNDGVLMSSGTTITSSGTGTVSVTGTGGSGTGGQNIGVHATGLITSGGNGTVTVIGTGGSGATGAANLGVEVDGTVTSGGTGAVTVTGTGGAGAGANNIGVYVPGLITSGSGTVQVTGTGSPGLGGNNLGVLDTGLISSPNTTLNVVGNVGGNTTIGIDLTTAGTAISGGSGNVNLTSTGIISETSPAIINTTGTLTTISVGGTTLTDNNTVSTFNATNSVSGSISFTNAASPLVITGVTETGGGNVIINNTGALTTNTAAITTAANGNITLNASGLATLGASVTAGGTGIVDINTAGVSQTAGSISATALRLQGTGTFTVTQTNAVGTIAANTTGAILFNNGATALIVGTVLGTSGITTSNNDATLKSGALSINQAINVGAGNTIRLQSSGAVSQGAGGTTTAQNLGVNAAGNVTLNGAINTVNTTFAASATAGGSITFIDAVGFSTGTVTANALFSVVTGVTTTANGNIALTATTGNLTVATGAGVTAGGAGAINLTTSAATGNININDAVSSTTGTITATTGQNIVFNAGSVTTGGNVSLTSTNAAGTVTQTTGATSVTATSGNLAITAGGGVGTGGLAFIFNVNTLTSNSSGNNGNQFLTDTATAHLAVINALNAGTGTITLVSGTFQITNGASGGNVNTVNDNSPLIVNTPAVFDLNGRNETVWSLAGTGSVTLGSGTLTSGNNTGDTPNFSGVISGTGGVTKVGSDDWTLSGNNTYTGTTNVGLTAPSTNGGILTVTGSINNTGAAAGGVVNLNYPGVILNGAGTIKGQVTVVASNNTVATNNTQIQAVTISLPTVAGGTGITVATGATFAKIGTTAGVTVNNGNATSTGVLVQGGASALIENSTITAQNIGVLVNGGIAALGSNTSAANGNHIDNNTLGAFATGLEVENSGIVDAGQVTASFTPPPNPIGYYGDITGLYSGTVFGSNTHSFGGNSFSGYTPMPSNVDTGVPQAIRDENTGIASFASAGVELSNNYSAVGPQLGRMDLTAQGNTWGAGNTTNTAIENLIYHDVDNPSLGSVSYGVSAQNPSVVGIPQYSASFSTALTTAQQGTDTLVSGVQPIGVGHQKSVIRFLKVVFDSFVFLDPNLKTPTTNLGLNLIKVNGPYGAPANTLIAGQLNNATYNEANGQYTVTYAFTGPGTEYGSLEDGNYTFQFTPAGIQGGGAGGPSLETTTVAGNPYLNTPASFYRLFGDTQGRAIVNNLDTPSDLAVMRQALGSVSPDANYLAYLDFGGNGYITGASYTAFLRRYNYTLNANGTVSTVPPTPPGSLVPKPLKTTLSNGVLTLTGTANGVGQLQTLEVIRTSGNSFQVYDDATVTATGLSLVGAKNFGVFNNVHGITLNLASVSENIIINLNGGVLPGNITINLGKGNTNPGASPSLQVSIVGTGTAADRVGGSVLINGGSGQETVIIGGLPPNDTTTPAASAVTIGGNVTFTGASQGGFQGNALTVQAGSTVNGSVILSQVSTVTIGDYGFAGGAVGGNLIVNDQNSAVAADVAILGRVGGVVSLNGTTGGGTGGDLFALSNNGTGTPGSIGGSAVINTGSGANAVFTDPGTFLGSSLSLLGGSGGNTVQLSGATGGNVFLYEGHGANQFTLANGASIGGSLTLFGGNGGNTVDLAGAVSGSAYFNMGNGINSFLLDTTGTITGKSLTYVGGTKNDSVTLNNGAANGFALYVTFFAGTRSLTFDAGFTPASAIIDFGVGFGTKALNYNGQAVTWNQTLRNYP